MYEEVAFLGINLMYFDKNNNSEMKRYNKRKAIRMICTK